MYVNDIVPEGLTFGGVPLSNPLLGAPVMPIIPDGDPLTSDVQLIREGITLTPGQIGEMIVRFTIDAGADLPNVVNEAKAGVANTDPENGPVCEPFVTGSNNTSSSGTAVPLPPVPNDAFKEDLLVNKTIILEPDHPL